MKTTLSYSTLNAAINEPHTYLNKLNGLKTYASPAMEEGKIAHQVIQKHCSGQIPLDKLLGRIPRFSLVEEKEWDERLKIKFSINDKYDLHGWVDGLEPTRREILEIKSSGTPWSIGQFMKLQQWRVYAIGLPEYERIMLVNVPRTADLWDESTIKIFNKEITAKDREDGMKWIHKGIDIIEHIGEQNLYPEFRSRFCFYINCPYEPVQD